MRDDRRDTLLSGSGTNLEKHLRIHRYHRLDQPEWAVLRFLSVIYFNRIPPRDLFLKYL